jgi:hypothetical protein
MKALSQPSIVQGKGRFDYCLFLVFIMPYMYFFMLNQELDREETLPTFIVVAFILLVSHRILYYAIALNTSIKEWILFLLHQSLYPSHIVLLILIFPLLPFFQVVRVYHCHYELLTSILLDLFSRIHNHFLMINLGEELDPGLIR